MRKDGDNRASGGGAKKFLYTGPKSKDTTEEEQWTYTPRKTTPQASMVDLDGVWSIKKNVGIGAAQQDKLNLNANKTFYSRHGGMKDKSASPVQSGSDDGARLSSRRGYSYTTGNSPDPLSSPSPGSRNTNKGPQDEFDF